MPLSSISPALILFALMCQMVFGSIFYKSFLTEFVLIIVSLVLFFMVAIRLKVVANYYIFGFLLIGFVYFFYSLFVEHRPLYWTARQGALLLYAIAALPPLFSKMRKLKTFHIYILLFISLLFSYFGWFIPGHANFVAFQVSLVLLCYLYRRINSLKFFFVYALVAFVLLANNEQTLLRLVIFVPLVLILLVNANWTLRFLSLFIIVPTLALAIILDGGALDYNAVWRYLYWRDLLLHNFFVNYVFFGNGFGGAYILRTYENYELLINQVSWSQNRIFQELSVPPHNAVLTLLHFMGLPSVWLVVTPIVKSLFVSFKDRMLHGSDLALFTVAVIGLNNQYLVVPYCALLFWFLWGSLSIWRKSE